MNGIYYRDLWAVLRKKWPNIPITVRARDEVKLEDYYDAGATVAVPETLETTLQLARHVLIQNGVDESEAHEVVRAYRKEIEGGVLR